MTTILGHTLFPHSADWRMDPDWSRRWQTGISESVSGIEQRLALRELPLHTLGFSLTAASLAERSRLDARIDQAKKSGYGCVPFFGRGSVLVTDAAAGTDELTLDDVAVPWAWAASDYVVLLGDDDTIYDVQSVSSIAGNTLTLAGNLTNNWRADEFVRPLLFGAFSSEAQSPINDWFAAVKISIAQLVAERNAQLGSVTPDTGTGVGHQVVGSTNVIG